MLYFDIKPRISNERGRIQANSMFFGSVGIVEDGNIDDKLLSYYAQNGMMLYGTVVRVEEENNRMISLAVQLY